MSNQDRPQQKAAPRRRSTATLRTWADRYHRALDRLERNNGLSRAHDSQVLRRIDNCQERLDSMQARPVTSLARAPKAGLRRKPRPVTPSFIRRRSGQSILVETGADSHVLTSRQAQGLLRCGGWDLVIDLVRKEIRFGGKIADLRCKERMVTLVEVLLDSRSRPLSLRELFEQAWECKWLDPETHTSSVYFGIHRLRQMLVDLGAPDCLSNHAGEGYVFELPAGAIALRKIRPRQTRRLKNDDVIMEIAREKGFVDNREVRRRTGWSRSQVLRKVRSLSDQGHLCLEGRGRGASYRLAEGL